MAYTIDTSRILSAMGYEFGVDFEATRDSDGVVIEWFHADPQPTEQEISDIASDTTLLPNGQTYTDYTTVPKEVTNYQLRRALNASPAAKAQVVALINGSEDDDMKDGWAAAATFKSDNPLFQAGITQLGWTQEQVNNILKLAATFQ